MTFVCLFQSVNFLVSETNVGFISVNVICTSPYEYKIITMYLTHFSAC